MSDTSIQQSKVNDLRGLLLSASPKMQEVAAKHIKAERVIRLLLAAAGRTPKILDCTKESLLRFCLKCAETGLEPIGAGGAWPVPYGNELTFIPDYRGLINCAKRAGCIRDAYAEFVKVNDQFDYALGMEPYLKHKPAVGDRGALVAAYCIIVFPDNTKRFVVMDKEEVLGIKKRSKAASSGPWVTYEAQMWCKTVVRRAMKPFAGASPELDAAIAADDAVTGAVDVTPRTPIAEPKALPVEPVAQGAPSESEPTPVDVVVSDDGSTPNPDANSVAIPDGCELAQGTVCEVRTVGLKRKDDARDGSYKKGDPYFKFDIMIEGDDMKYSTFSESLAEEASKLKGKKVTLIWKPSGAYRNAVSIHPVTQ